MQATNKNNKGIKECQKTNIYPGLWLQVGKIEKKMIEILNKQQIPYVLTWNTIDFSSTKSDGNMGLLGISGTREGNLAIKYSDLVVAVGSHLSKMLTGDQLNNSQKMRKKYIYWISIKANLKDSRKIDGLNATK